MAPISTVVNTYGCQWGRMAVVTPDQTGLTGFARAILVLKNERGWSYRRIARAMGISHTQVSRYVAEGDDPGLSGVVALADAAQVGMDWLVGRETPQPTVEVNGVTYVPASDALDGERGEGSSAIADAARVIPARERERQQAPPAPKQRHRSRP